ncbi:MAG: tetratricopeptide repeat protein [Roseiarcus sp.]
MIAFASSHLLALPAALVAGALVALVVFRLGRGGFSPRLFGVAVASGAMLAFLPATLGPFLARLHLALPPPWDIAFMAFVLAGLAEEGTKLAAAWLFVRPYYERRTNSDLVLGVASVALGFALIENVVYLFAAADRWPATALARMATAVPFHALVGLVLGGGLARAEAAGPGAARALLVARAWLIAAALHGFYDFPLFVAARAPLFPLPINELALAFGTTTPTLLAALYLGALLLAGVAATRVVVRLRAQVSAEFARDRPRRPLRPRLLDRFMFARATGLAVGALTTIPSAIWLVLTASASLAGMIPVMTYNALSVCAASILLGAIAALRASPPGAAVAPRRRPLLADPRALGAAAIVAVGAALLLFSGAIDAARRALIADALVISGSIYAGQGELDRAMDNYDAALRYKPDFVAALIQRAAANRTYQRYQRELDDLNAAARLAPDEPGILGERANAYENLHRFDEALADLDRALALEADDPALLTLRAEILTNRGDAARAAVDLDHALQLKPDLPLAHAVRGDMLLQQVDYPGALRELDEAIRLDPGFAPAYFTRGRVHFFRGEFPAAVADFVQSDSRQTFAYDTLWLYLARARAGQNGRNELIFWAGRLSRNAWPFPLIELYGGARSAPAALAAAADPDQRCEADFYVAEWLLLQKLEQPAIAGFRRAAATCPKSFIEQNAAVAELSRLAPAAPAPGAGAAGASLAAAGGPVYAGSASWRRIAQDDSLQRPDALAVQAVIPELAIRLFVTIEKARGDQPAAPYALTMRLVQAAAPGERPPFQLRGDLGVPSVAGAQGAGPLRLAGPLVRVVGDTFQADIGDAEIAYDLAALSQGARLDIPLSGVVAGRGGRTDFDLIVDVDAPAATAAHELAALWLQPAPAAAPAPADPGAAAPYYERGVADEAQGRTDEAVAEYRAAIRLDPGHAGAHRGLGAALKEQGLLDQAVEELRLAARLEPDDAESHRLLGDVRLERREFDEAIAEYGRASSLRPTDATPHRLLGWAMLEFARGQAGERRAAQLREACEQFVEGGRLEASDPNFAILEGMVEALLAPSAHCPP